MKRKYRAYPMQNFNSTHSNPDLVYNLSIHRDAILLRKMKVFLLSGLGIFLILFCQYAAALSGTDTLIYSPNITLVEDSPGYYEFSSSFHLDGDFLVWMNTWSERKIENPMHRDTIYLLTLSGNETKVLSQTPGIHHEYSFLPALSFSNDSLVWTEFLKNDIFLYTISTQEERQITRDGSARNSDEREENKNPVISGDRIVWAKKKVQSTTGDFDIVMMNISTGVQQDICTLSADQIDPYISGSSIVWTDKRNEPKGGDIYLFDLDGDNEIPICTDSGLQKYPKIYNDTVIWRDYRDGSPTVYQYNLTSGAKSRISDPAFDAGEPFIADNYIAWTEYSRFDRRDTRSSRLCLYTIANGTREILPVSSSYPILLDLDKNRILYEVPDNKSMKNGFLHLFVINSAVATPGPLSVPPGAGDKNQTLPAASIPETTVTHQSPVSVLSLITALGCYVLLYRKMRKQG